jgi:hypothetical protein
VVDIRRHSLRYGKYQRDTYYTNRAGKCGKSCASLFGKEVFERKHKRGEEGHLCFFLLLFDQLLFLALVFRGLRGFGKLGFLFGDNSGGFSLFILGGEGVSILYDFAVKKKLERVKAFGIDLTGIYERFRKSAN